MITESHYKLYKLSCSKYIYVFIYVPEKGEKIPYA